MTRSEIMRSVGRFDTEPERRVRKVAHEMGLRFRLHRKDLPGTPDLVFPKYRTCVFVHGCFWHRHPGCRKTTTPKTHQDFWLEKFARNMERDARITKELEALGWKVCIVWECETEDPETIRQRLQECLGLRT